MHPVIALVTAGVEMDVLGIAFSEFSEAEREAVVRAHPRPGRFKEEIIQAFYDGIRCKPETTFGNVKADVPRRQRSLLSAREFLPRDPRLCLARLSSIRATSLPPDPKEPACPQQSARGGRCLSLAVVPFDRTPS
jgi:hypothetical protein